MTRLIIFLILLIISATFFLSLFGSISTMEFYTPALADFLSEHPFVALLLWIASLPIAIISIIQVILGIREISYKISGAVALGYFYTVDGLPQQFTSFRMLCIISG